MRGVCAEHPLQGSVRDLSDVGVCVRVCVPGMSVRTPTCSTRSRGSRTAASTTLARYGCYHTCGAQWPGITCACPSPACEIGQSCCGIERVYVHQSLYADFVEGLVEQVKAHKLGDPMDAATTIGPMAQDNAPAFLAAQVADATSKGARLLHGGAPCKDAAGNGRFFAPTVLADCKHDMSVMVVCPVRRDLLLVWWPL